MPRKIKVATTSFGLPMNTTAQRNIEIAYSLLDAAGSHRADIVCLPETFTSAGVAASERGLVAEPIPGPLYDGLAEKARRYGMYVVAGLLERRGDHQFNTAVVIDRQGQLVGQYDKIHPTIGEVESGTIPGGEVKVFDLEFGRVGLAICYDIGWPAHWDKLGELGAEMVIWPSAYDGGFPIQTYAWRNFYYVVSSVWSWHSRVFDITGQELASTSRFSRLVTQEIDLEKMIFHTDRNAEKLLDLDQQLGARATVHTMSEEHVFTLESNDPRLAAADIARQFGLEPFRAYHARAEQVQNKARHEAV